MERYLKKVFFEYPILHTKFQFNVDNFLVTIEFIDNAICIYKKYDQASQK
jgi:hypothetical protein